MSFSSTTRRAASSLLVLGIGLLASGCINFNGATSATQVAATGDVGTTLRYTFSICSDSLDDGSCNPHTGVSPTRLIAGILVPVGSMAPEIVTGALSEPIAVERDGVGAMRTDLRAFRSSQLASELTLQQAPPAGSTWVGYISEFITVGTGATPNGTVTIDVALQRDQGGSPLAASAMRQVSIAGSGGSNVTGADPAPGQTDTLGYECWEDANNDGVPEQAFCIDEVDPATPQAVTLRRLNLTGASSATVTEAGGNATSDVVLRLDGPALPTPAVSITTAITGAGLTASAPATVITTAGANVTVPVTLNAAKGAQPGTLTVTATTSNGTKRVAIVPVNVLSDDDGTRPSTTITARRLAGGTLRLDGQATDQNRSAGLISVKVQAFRGVRNGRCLAWNGTKIVNERCTQSLARWITLPLTIAPATTTVDWTAATPVASSGLWVLRARADDGDGLVSRVGTARVTMAAAQPMR